MADFPLKIITPIKTVYNDRAKSVLMRTTEGDVCILANHENYVAPLSIGFCAPFSFVRYSLISLAGALLVFESIMAVSPLITGNNSE